MTKKTATVLVLALVLILASCSSKDFQTPQVTDGMSEMPSAGMTGTAPAEETVKTGETAAPVGACETKKGEHLKYPVPETVSFGAFDFSGVDRISLSDGTTGLVRDVADPAAIRGIADFLGKITGSSPESARGYYGSLYYLEMFMSGREILTLGIIPDDMLTYGTYEEINGFRYPALYRISGAKTEEIREFFSVFFTDASLCRPYLGNQSGTVTDTAFEVPANVDLGTLELSSVDRIEIYDFRTGKTAVVTGSYDTAKITGTIGKITGQFLSGSRNYHAAWYLVRLFRSGTCLCDISFGPGTQGTGVFIYGLCIAEDVNGYDYEAMYRMSGESLEDIAGILAPFFGSESD